MNFSFGTFVGNAIRSLSGNEKPQAMKRIEPKQPPLPSEPLYKAPQEKLDVTKSSRGTAQLNLNDSVETMVGNWGKASKGTGIPQIQNAIKNGKTPTKAVFEYIKETGAYSGAETSNIADFLEGVMKSGSVEGSENKDFNGKNLIDVMTEGLKEHGITVEQLEMLADGKFTAEAYQAMVKDGRSIG